MDISHSDLIKRGVKYWSNKRFRTILYECPGIGLLEIPDIIAWKSNSINSVLTEVKVSRQDFRGDLKKPFREFPEAGMGRLRYYLAPKGLVKKGELPLNWGLLEFTGKIIRRKVEAIPFDRYNRNDEILLLISASSRYNVQRAIIKQRQQLALKVVYYFSMFWDSNNLQDLDNCRDFKDSLYLLLSHANPKLLKDIRFYKISTRDIIEIIKRHVKNQSLNQ